MSLFTPVTGILGGSLIGGSAGVLLVLNGDIMGISGIITNSLVNPIESLRNPKYHWRWVFLASFSLAVNTYITYLTPEVALKDTRTTDHDDVPIPSLAGHILGGLLVGIGARLQNGCTTGHGICGIARFSTRSLTATVAFTAISMLTRFLVSPVRAWGFLTDFLRKQTMSVVSPLASELVAVVLALVTMARPVFGASEVDSAKSVGAALSGIMFAAGLGVSGMTKNSKVHDFLCFSNLARHNFDPTLIAVMASGILSSLLSYQFVKGYGIISKNACESPVCLPKGEPFAVPTNKSIDTRLMMGSALFGIGWGLTGICPGPGIYAAAAGVVDAIVGWMPGFLLGSFVGGKIIEYTWEKRDEKTKNA